MTEEPEKILQEINRQMVLFFDYCKSDSIILAFRGTQESLNGMYKELLVQQKEKGLIWQ